MKYYLIVGEASGDLHASHLMRSLKQYDAEAEFRFFGGDNMTAVGGTRVRHYKDLAYMGFVPVLLHLRTIFRNMAFCKRDITEWQPDAVILVDYPGFNLDIAKYVKRGERRKATGRRALLGNEERGERNARKGERKTSTYYYISPKIWAWKEYRIKNIRRDIDEMFSILPFEVPFYAKHNYPIHYVGNPTADEVRSFRAEYKETREEFSACNGIPADKPIIALLAGSRKQEIKDNLPAMIEAADGFADYELVLAGAPSIERSYYDQFLSGTRVRFVDNDTYALLSHSTAALVTSGTATLETALFDVPQVVCYETPVPRLIRFAFNHIIKVKYISLVNLIADSEVVPELLADRFSVENIRHELSRILTGGEGRADMMRGYGRVHESLGTLVAPDNAARQMVELLNNR